MRALTPACVACRARGVAHQPGLAARRERGAQDPQIEAKVAALLARMTLEQKVGQMVQADIRSVTPEDVRKYRLGSVLNGGGAFPGENKHASVADWVALADRFYDASMDTASGAPAIPIMWGTDAVHGHNNVIGATLFPHNIGLGAAHDPDLMERIGAVTAREVAATGLDWTFAPIVAVVRDDRWGRTYESYSEDPEIVRDVRGPHRPRAAGRAAARSEFLDASHVLATAKHFIGDGGTADGVDRGDNRAPKRSCCDIHAPGLRRGARGRRADGHGVVQQLEGLKVHGQQLPAHGRAEEAHGLRRHRRQRLGRRRRSAGLLEGQVRAGDQRRHRHGHGADRVEATSSSNTLDQVRAEKIPLARIDDAVTRILRVKFRAGLFEKGRPSSRPLANKRELVGAPEHRELARQAVRKSLVLLKNERGLLPLRRKSHVLVVGDGADNIPKQTRRLDA